jgi:hypothetical protein
MNGWIVIGPGDGIVEVWSSRRLPFQPKGSSLDLRSHLRESLRQRATNVGDGYSLDASYSSAHTSLVDVENVLLYNVGVAAVGRPRAVKLECRYQAPA